MYNPSDVGKKGSLFGLPYSRQESDIILLPVNLDVTVSYNDGTSEAPNLILEESRQLDLSLPDIINPWELKMTLAERIVSKEDNDLYRKKAKNIIDHMEAGIEFPNQNEVLSEVNTFCENLNSHVEKKCNELMKQGKMIGIVGGDHSSSFGFLKALAKRTEFGILQIDAHMDLRKSYEEFEYSHASIMHNALKLEGISSLTQVGIRDYCEEEELYIANSKKQIDVFYDANMFAERMSSALWKDQVAEIVKLLPDNVYISFDIDGLDPSLCPNTGTPVPGGLKFNEVNFLMESVVKAGKKIIGFDLCEVGNSVWDANVGARILFRLATAMGLSKGLLNFK